MELASLAKSEKSTLSRQVATLIRQNWLLKERQADKRSYKIHLTPTGKQSLLTLEEQMQTTWQRIFHAWPAEEQQLLQILLGRLNRNIAENNLETSPSNITLNKE